MTSQSPVVPVAQESGSGVGGSAVAAVHFNVMVAVLSTCLEVYLAYSDEYCTS